MLQFDVDREGVPGGIEVIESDPPGVFDDAAVLALKQWRYCPSAEDRLDYKVRLNFEPGARD